MNPPSDNYLSAPDGPNAIRVEKEDAFARSTPRPRLGLLLIATLVVIAIGLVFGMLPKFAQRAALGTQTRELAVISVKVVQPMPAKAAPPLVLSGELKPLIEAAIYARTSGYVRRWLVELGAHVESGQLLAELETPDLDREQTQARAELKQAEAAFTMAEATAKRWAEMRKTQTISPQEAEEKQSDFIFKKALVEAASSKLQRLDEIKHFAQITAPFSGTVTERKIDVGQLVSAGTEHELYRIAQVEKIRVFIRVPQNYARAVTQEQKAELTIPELPGRSFEAKVVRTAGAIDAASRTLLVELEVDNAKSELLTGSFARVRLSEAQPEAALTLPANALVFRAEGTLVATVDKNLQILFRPVTLGRDFGTSVEILTGVASSDQVVSNPPDSLVNGAVVRVAP